jgi:hypothetical protein
MKAHVNATAYLSMHHPDDAPDACALALLAAANTSAGAILVLDQFGALTLVGKRRQWQIGRQTYIKARRGGMEIGEMSH